MTNKKGQTSMEYLMTYGWAIIIVIIIGLVLWKLNVFAPSTPKASRDFDTFSIGTDFQIASDGDATIIITNHDKLSRTLIIQSVIIDNVDSCGVDNEPLAIEESWEIFCTDVALGRRGTPYTGIPVSIVYSYAGTNYTESGYLSGKFE